MTTIEYREIQLKKLFGLHNSDFTPTVKFTSPNGHTNNLDITWIELEAIRKVLLHIA